MSEEAPQPVVRQPDRIQSELDVGAVGLSTVLMQSVASTGPAIAVLFTVQFLASLLGVGMVFGYLAAAVVTILLAVTVYELARHLPAAGGYYTWVSHTVHPRAGLFTAWMFVMYTAVAVGLVVPFTGYVLQQALLESYDFNMPWWPTFVVIVLLVSYMMYRGIKLSGAMLILLGGFEVAIIAVLAIWGLFDPGPGGFNLSPFDPSNLSLNSLYLAGLFSIFAYIGWETAPSLSEEARQPRRNVPKAVVGSILILTGLFFISSWGFLIGWGTDNLDAFAKSSDNPGIVLAKQFWGSGWWVVMAAVISSSIAYGVALGNVTTRMWYAMARSGSLPRSFATLHPTHRTPVVAILAWAILTFVSGFGGVALLSSSTTFVFFGYLVVFALVPIYIAGNLGVYRYYRNGPHSDEFSAVKHAVIPLISSLILVWLAYKTLNPLPPGDLKWAPIIDAVWIVGGLVLLVVLNRLGKEEWLLEAGKITQVGDDSEDEVLERPVAAAMR